MGSGQDQKRIFLVGFMASGKTTVGARLARRVGLPFIDLDAVIESAAGRSIGEIFSSSGEGEFRALEARALDEVSAANPAVIATGGGAPCQPGNLARMRTAGVVISLDVELAEVARRTEGDKSRPLLEQETAALEELYEQRLPIYRQAHASIATTGVGVDRVVDRVLETSRSLALVDGEVVNDTAVVALEGRSYPVVVHPGSLSTVGQLARRALGAGCRRVGLISDDNVMPLYGHQVAASLSGAGFEVVSATVAAGEGSKSWSELGRLCDAMVAGGLDRGSAVVALGGGVVGDVAGFVAACLFRGVRLIQVPTSLVAMTDSAVGGKTGVNITAGKNLVGAFWQPDVVVADPRVLTTLPLRERRAALGELVKYGLLDGEELYAEIEELAPHLCAETLSEDPVFQDRLAALIRRCVAYKAWVVGRDEREQTGDRALLNLGHTVGHAIEAEAGYGNVLHGEAVALGLLAACRLSADLAGRTGELESRVRSTLESGGLNVSLDPWLRDEVLLHIGVDKKRSGTRVAFVTIDDVGKCRITPLELSVVHRILRGQNSV